MGSCLKYMHLFPPLFYRIRLGPRRYILERCHFLLRRHKEQYVYFKMSDLTNEEKVYLIECFYSRGKNYTEAYRGFRTKFGSKRVASKNTLRRVIDNFINYYTLDDRRHDLPGPSYTVTTEDKVAEVEEHFKNNPTDSIRKAAVALKLNRETLRLIMKKFIKLHPYKITTHQLLTVDCKEKRIEFSKVMTNKLENNEININHIIFSDEAHFYLNGYVNKQNYRFWGTENPHLTEAKSLHPVKVTVWAAISIKGVHLEFFEETITSNRYREMLQTKFFPFAKKRGLVKNYYFMQDGAAPHRTREVFEAIYEVYGERVIGLGYPKFAHAGIEWPPYSPDLNPCDFFLWGFLKDYCYAEKPKTKNDLREAIRKGISNISSSTIEQSFYSFQKRLDYCASSDGDHFENIYH